MWRRWWVFRHEEGGWVMGSFAAWHGKKSIPLWQQTCCSAVRGDRFQLPTSSSEWNLSGWGQLAVLGRAANEKSWPKLWQILEQLFDFLSSTEQTKRHAVVIEKSRWTTTKLKGMGWMNRKESFSTRLSMRVRWVWSVIPFGCLDSKNAHIARVC